MSDAFWTLLICLSSAVLLLWVRRLSRRLAAARSECERIEGGEGWMFEFRNPGSKS